MASTSGDTSAAEALRRGRILSSRLYLDGVPSSKVRHPPQTTPPLSSRFAAVGFVTTACRSPRHPWSTRRRMTSSSTGSRNSEWAKICHTSHVSPHRTTSRLSAVIHRPCLTRARACRHPFDSAKWGRVRNFLVDAGLLQNDRIIEPLEASEDDLLVVRTNQLLFTWCAADLYCGMQCKFTIYGLCPIQSGALRVVLEQP